MIGEIIREIIKNTPIILSGLPLKYFCNKDKEIILINPNQNKLSKIHVVSIMENLFSNIILTEPINTDTIIIIKKVLD
jgi:hypothetical protein